MTLKTKEELEVMRRAGRIVSDLLLQIEKEVKPGVSTRRLDEIAEEFIIKRKAIPAFKGYQGYPATLCASVNEEVVHGIPGARVLKDGDIVGIDVGVRMDGYFSDAARTFAVGNIDEESRRLMAVTRLALEEACKKAVEGNRLGDIAWAVQSTAEKAGYSVVRQFVGHGIGKALHEEPEIPNFGRPHEGLYLKCGMALAIEPMVNIGTYEVDVLPDRWTAVTKDRKRSCHFEQTVFVGKEKPEIVTA